MEKPSQSPLESLCDELLLQIVSHLDAPDVLTLRKTSPRLASVSADSFGDSFFGCLKTDLSLRSLARLSAIARTEHIRRRVRVLLISPFPWRSSVCPYDDASRGGGPTRKKGWFRDADGRLDMTTPTAVSLLKCIRDGFPRCRSFVVDDKGWGSYHPHQRPDWQVYHPPYIPGDLVMMYPTDALALVLAFAADPANPGLRRRPGQPVAGRARPLSPIHEHLLRPDAVRRGNWEGLHTLHFTVDDRSYDNVRDDGVDATTFGHTDGVRPFIHSLLREARNLETLEFAGNNGAAIDSCIEALCQPERRRSPADDNMRHLTITGSDGQSSWGRRHRVSHVWLEQLFSRPYTGGKLESLCLKSVFLRQGNRHNNLWPRILERVRQTSPNLRTFVLESRPGDFIRDEPFHFCPLFKSLTGRLGPASQDCPDENPQNHDGGLCCSMFSDEHGGTFRFESTVLLRQSYMERDYRSKLHEFSVRYQRGDTGTAEGMDRALGDIAHGVCYLKHGPGPADHDCLWRAPVPQEQDFDLDLDCDIDMSWFLAGIIS